MEYEDISPEMRDAFHEMLKEHLIGSLSNLITDRKNGILPMISIKGVQNLQEELNRMAKNPAVEAFPLTVAGNEGASDAIIGLVSMDGQIDVDKAYERAIWTLNCISFERALFSYSTKAVTSDGSMMDALKTILIDKSGVALIIFTPYVYTGFLKKKVEYQQHILGGTIENIFDGENHN